MRGATPEQSGQLYQDTISIHAPHARSDYQASAPGMDYASISIHAPHARSDCTRARSSASSINFNPRSSCEERRGVLLDSFDFREFQSTLLMRGATTLLWTACLHRSHFNPRSSCEERRRTSTTWRRIEEISIHAPHARSDNGQLSILAAHLEISIHAPHARSDLACALPGLRRRHFNPRSSCEERRGHRVRHCQRR